MVRRKGHRLKLDERTSARLAKQPQRNTKPELLVRAAAAQLGLRYRLHNPDLPGRPDLANRSQRWVIFVHGCFWHSHLECARATIPKRNRTFWLNKFKDNRSRDTRVVSELERAGYRVLTVWECEAVDERILRRRLGRFATRIRHSSRLGTVRKSTPR
jgi:DNA mismatch endonuclease (patch repair protein)